MKRIKPISSLPSVLKPPVWGKFLAMSIANEPKDDKGFMIDRQMYRYRCTHNFTAIYKAGTYYYCLSIYRGYRNLTALKRLI